MKLIAIVPGFAAVAVAAGLPAVSLPAANAAPSVEFSSQNGQIVGTARGMRTMPKDCLLSRELRADVDGPLSTLSSDSRLTNGAQGSVTGSQITLRTKRLPPGWYEVIMSCSYTDHGFNRIEVTRASRVYNT